MRFAGTARLGRTYGADDCEIPDTAVAGGCGPGTWLTDWSEEIPDTAVAGGCGPGTWLTVLAEYRQLGGSSAEALPNQCTGWCCMDRLRWQRLSGATRIFSVLRVDSAASRSTNG